MEKRKIFNRVFKTFVEGFIVSFIASFQVCDWGGDVANTIIFVLLIPAAMAGISAVWNAYDNYILESVLHKDLNGDGYIGFVNDEPEGIGDELYSRICEKTNCVEDEEDAYG